MKTVSLIFLFLNISTIFAGVLHSRTKRDEHQKSISPNEQQELQDSPKSSKLSKRQLEYYTDMDEHVFQSDTHSLLNKFINSAVSNPYHDPFATHSYEQGDYWRSNRRPSNVVVVKPRIPKTSVVKMPVHEPLSDVLRLDSVPPCRRNYAYVNPHTPIVETITTGNTDDDSKYNNNILNQVIKIVNFVHDKQTQEPVKDHSTKNATKEVTEKTANTTVPTTVHQNAEDSSVSSEEEGDVDKIFEKILNNHRKNPGVSTQGTPRSLLESPPDDPGTLHKDSSTGEQVPTSADPEDSKSNVVPAKENDDLDEPTITEQASPVVISDPIANGTKSTITEKEIEEKTEDVKLLSNAEVPLLEDDASDSSEESNESGEEHLSVLDLESIKTKADRPIEPIEDPLEPIIKEIFNTTEVNNAVGSPLQNSSCSHDIDRNNSPKVVIEKLVLVNGQLPNMHGLPSVTPHDIGNDQSLHRISDDLYKSIMEVVKYANTNGIPAVVSTPKDDTVVPPVEEPILEHDNGRDKTVPDTELNKAEGHAEEEVIDDAHEKVSHPPSDVTKQEVPKVSEVIEEDFKEHKPDVAEEKNVILVKDNGPKEIPSILPEAEDVLGEAEVENVDSENKLKDHPFENKIDNVPIKDHDQDHTTDNLEDQPIVHDVDHSKSNKDHVEMKPDEMKHTTTIDSHSGKEHDIKEIKQENIANGLNDDVDESLVHNPKQEDTIHKETEPKPEEELFVHAESDAKKESSVEKAKDHVEPIEQEISELPTPSDTTLEHSPTTKDKSNAPEIYDLKKEDLQPKEEKKFPIEEEIEMSNEDVATDDGEDEFMVGVRASDEDEAMSRKGKKAQKNRTEKKKPKNIKSEEPKSYASKEIAQDGDNKDVENGNKPLGDEKADEIIKELAIPNVAPEDQVGKNENNSSTSTEEATALEKWSVDVLKSEPIFTLDELIEEVFNKQKNQFGFVPDVLQEIRDRWKQTYANKTEAAKEVDPLKPSNGNPAPVEEKGEIVANPLEPVEKNDLPEFAEKPDEILSNKPADKTADEDKEALASELRYEVIPLENTKPTIFEQGENPSALPIDNPDLMKLNEINNVKGEFDSGTNSDNFNPALNEEDFGTELLSEVNQEYPFSNLPAAKLIDEETSKKIIEKTPVEKESPVEQIPTRKEDNIFKRENIGQLSMLSNLPQTVPIVENTNMLLPLGVVAIKSAMVPPTPKLPEPIFLPSSMSLADKSILNSPEILLKNVNVPKNPIRSVGLTEASLQWKKQNIPNRILQPKGNADQLALGDPNTFDRFSLVPLDPEKSGFNPDNIMLNRLKNPVPFSPKLLNVQNPANAIPMRNMDTPQFLPDPLDPPSSPGNVMPEKKMSSSPFFPDLLGAPSFPENMMPEKKIDPPKFFPDPPAPPSSPGNVILEKNMDPSPFFPDLLSAPSFPENMMPEKKIDPPKFFPDPPAPPSSPGNVILEKNMDPSPFFPDLLSAPSFPENMMPEKKIDPPKFFPDPPAPPSSPGNVILEKNMDPSPFFPDLLSAPSFPENMMPEKKIDPPKFFPDPPAPPSSPGNVILEKNMDPSPFFPDLLSAPSFPENMMPEKKIDPPKFFPDPPAPPSSPGNVMPEKKMDPPQLSLDSLNRQIPEESRLQFNYLVPPALPSKSKSKHDFHKTAYPLKSKYSSDRSNENFNEKISKSSEESELSPVNLWEAFMAGFSHGKFVKNLPKSEISELKLNTPSQKQSSRTESPKIGFESISPISVQQMGPDSELNKDQHQRVKPFWFEDIREAGNASSLHHHHGIEKRSVDIEAKIDEIFQRQQNPNANNESSKKSANKSKNSQDQTKNAGLKKTSKVEKEIPGTTVLNLYPIVEGAEHFQPDVDPKVIDEFDETGEECEKFYQKHLGPLMEKQPDFIESTSEKQS